MLIPLFSSAFSPRPSPRSQSGKYPANTASFLLALCCALAPVGALAADKPGPKFKVVKTGLLPLYQYGDIKRQDVSGAAMNNNLMLLADDGGPNADFQEVRIANPDALGEEAALLRRQVKQKDLEGMTVSGDVFYLTSSMSQMFEDSDDYLVLSALTIDPQSRKVGSEKYAYMRDPIVNTLRDRFQHQEWFGRISTAFPKEGGLNVEGLSMSHTQKEALVFGLRSPLWSTQFGSPNFGSEFSLDQGDALLVHVKNPFTNAPELSVETLDLKGEGIRSLEYIPQLLGGDYLIISGPVIKDGKAFNFWWYQPGAAPVKLALPEFAQLCRPESITYDPKNRRVFLLSEQSGPACEKQKYTYIELSY